MNTEKLILANLIYNEEFTRKVLPFIKEEYFNDNSVEGESEKKIYSLINDFFIKYNKIPTKEALTIELQNLNGLSEDLFKEAAKTIKDLQIDKNTELDWIVDKTEKFCQEKAIYNAIFESINIINNKKSKLDKGAIPKILQDALAVSFDSSVGHDWAEDAKERYDLYHLQQNKIPFDLEYLNKVTKGGISKKTETLIMAPIGVGKTLFMCHCAAAHYLSGRNVFYMTNEMAEKGDPSISQRIDANLLDVELDDLKALPEDVFNKRIEKVRNKTSGKLIIKEFATGTASSITLRHALDEAKAKKNFIPDVVYVDYLNLMASAKMKIGSNVNSYLYIKSIAEELRAVAIDYNVALVTATQVGRQGINASDFDMEDTSESIGLPATVDLHLALIQTGDLAALNQILVKQLKNRYSDKNNDNKFVIGVNKSKMRLYDCEQISQQDIDKDEPVMNKTAFGERDENDSKPKSKFKKKMFEGFK